MIPAQRKMFITGRTTFVPLVGHPVEQVKSPGPMNSWFAENDVDGVIIPMDIRPERIAAFFDVLRAIENCAGCSVTMPHKQAAFVACDEVTERARRAKAVNTIRRSQTGRLTGDMTDGAAFVAALGLHGVSVRGRHVLLVGAGGAGTAIAFELASEGAASLTVLEKDQLRQRALLSELARFHPELVTYERVPAGGKIEIAVNASTLGMGDDDPLPYPVDGLGDALIVADAVTKPAVTPWLVAARERGIAIQTGEEMAVAQLPIQLTYLKFMSAKNAKADNKTTVEKA